MRELANIQEKFNYNVLMVVSCSGLLRIAIEFVVYPVTFDHLDFYLDIGYGILFVSTLIVLLKKSSYRVITFTFAIPLILLLCITLFDRRGLASSIENNIHVGIIVLALTSKGFDSVKYSIVLLIGTVFALAFVEYKYHFFENYSDYSTSNFNFIFMSIGTIVAIFYAKQSFEKGKESLRNLQLQLSEKNIELQKTSKRLNEQTIELEELNLSLEKKVDERIAILKDQKGTIKDYLDITLKELHKEHSEMRELTDAIDFEDMNKVKEMLKISAERLNVELYSLIEKLESDHE